MRWSVEGSKGESTKKIFTTKARRAQRDLKGRPGRFSYEGCLADLESIRKSYKIGRWIIGGHSWGADLALIYGLEYTPHVEGLICITGGRVHNDREWHSEYQRRKPLVGEQLLPFDYPPNEEVNEQLNREMKGYIQNPALFRKISELKAPAIFIYGNRDIRPSCPVEQVANLMPEARFELIEGAEHVFIHFRSHPVINRNRIECIYRLRNCIFIVNNKSLS